MTCKHGEIGILCAWCDAVQIAALPDADCRNCEYMRLNGPRSGGHCYMFRDKPGLKCGQFRAVRREREIVDYPYDHPLA